MLWPVTARRDTGDELCIGGIRVSALARQYGTPLYIYDEATLRQQCRAYRQALSESYSRPRVTYAGKAWLSTALLKIIAEEGLSLDVVSGGELYVALKSGFPAGQIAFHGNNKSRDELAMAIEAGVGRIVIDNLYEIDLLMELAAQQNATVAVLLRLNPGIEAHTHDYRKTGTIDSKFGLGIATGDAERAVERVLSQPELTLQGFHAHIGSQIFEVDPFVETVDALFAFAASMRDRYGIVPDEISPGGGFAVQHEESDPETDNQQYARRIAAAVVDAAARHDMPEPEMAIEPGRSIVGPAGVAVYTVGTIKEIPDVRTYVSVDGGMADNIRPALYGAVYSAVHGSRSNNGSLYPVTIAGKFCESGDVLINRVALPSLKPGDLLVIPAAGAYCLAMASNYNMALRPAVVFVADGNARLVQRRETYEELLSREIAEESGT